MSEAGGPRSVAPSPEVRPMLFDDVFNSLPEFRGARVPRSDSHLYRETSLYAPRKITTLMRAAVAADPSFPSIKMLPSSPPAKKIESIRPFGEPFYDDNDTTKPWYDCVHKEKLALLGLFSMLSYNGDDDSLGVPHRLVDRRHSDSKWTDLSMAALMEHRFNTLRMEFTKAGILHLDDLNDWFFHDNEEQSAARLCSIVIDGLIGRGLATEVFKEAIFRLNKDISAINLSYQTLRCVLQMIMAYDQIFKTETASKKVPRPMDMMELDAKFVELLRKALGHICVGNEHSVVLEKKADEIEMEANWGLKEGDHGKGLGVEDADARKWLL